VGAEFFECAGERFAVAVAEVLSEVLLDRVAVVAARLLHRRAALVGEDDEDRAAVVVRADSLDEAPLFEPLRRHRHDRSLPLRPVEHQTLLRRLNEKTSFSAVNRAERGSNRVPCLVVARKTA
jgi:hypothetical protein